MLDYGKKIRALRDKKNTCVSNKKHGEDENTLCLIHLFYLNNKICLNKKKQTCLTYLSSIIVLTVISKE
jgi:hypothetical protein